MTDDILGNQTVCPSCAQLNVRLPFYFWGAPFSHLCERCLADLETGEHRLVARETGHGRWEIDCPKCKQVNVRSTTGLRTLLNPRYANLCTLCGTPLDPLIGWSLMTVGAVAGIALAEWSRRRGTLLSNRRS